MHGRNSTEPEKKPPGAKRVQRLASASDASNIDPNTSIGALVRDAYLGFKQALHDQLQPRKVTSAQWVFLRILWREDGLTQKELSDRVGNHPSTTVDALRVLERNGYVRRTKDADDGRAIRVHLTAKGLALRGALLPYAAKVNDAALAGVTPQEFETLCVLLRKVRANLDRWNRDR